MTTLHKNEQGSDTNSLDKMKQWLLSKLNISASDHVPERIRSRADNAVHNTMNPHDFINGSGCSHLPASTQKTMNDFRSRGQSSPLSYPSMWISLPPTRERVQSGGEVFRLKEEQKTMELIDPSQLYSQYKCPSWRQHTPSNKCDMADFLPAQKHVNESEMDYSCCLDGSRGTIPFDISAGFDRKIHVYGLSPRTTNAASNSDVHKFRPSERKESVRRAGPKERVSTITKSMQPSWFTDTGNSKITRRESLRSLDERINDSVFLARSDKAREGKGLASYNINARSCYNSDEIPTVEDDESYPEWMASHDSVSSVTLLTPWIQGLIDDSPPEWFESMYASKRLQPNGEIKIMFQFLNNRFLVTILKGTNIARRKNGTLGVYTKVFLVSGKQQMKKGTDKHDSHNPVFYEHFSFHVGLDELLDSQLRIKLYNKPGTLSIPESVGECTVPLLYYDLTETTVIWQKLKKSKKPKDVLA